MAEKRYIERKLLRKLMLEAGEIAEYKGVIHHVVPISIIDNAPTADVVEVRHGEWLPDYEIFVNEPFDTYADRIQTGWKCSLCGKVECEKEPYCNCGAKMDGNGEGE